MNIAALLSEAIGLIVAETEFETGTIIMMALPPSFVGLVGSLQWTVSCVF